MKKNIWNLVTVFSIALLCVCLIQIANLKQEIQNIRASVTPKEYNPDITKASIIINAQEIPMEFSNGEILSVKL